MARRTARHLIAGATALAATGCGSAQHVASPPATTATAPVFSPVDPTPAPDFALEDQDGRRVQLRAQRGHPVLLAFLYTRCPDVCPVIASNVNAALRLLPTGTSTGVLAVSVDPEHDTPAAVDRFVAEHRLAPRFRYLNGPRPVLQRIWQSYNILATARTEEQLDHSASILLIDREGRLRGSFTPTAPARAIARAVAGLSS